MKNKVTSMALVLSLLLGGLFLASVSTTEPADAAIGSCTRTHVIINQPMGGSKVEFKTTNNNLFSDSCTSIMFFRCGNKPMRSHIHTAGWLWTETDTFCRKGGVSVTYASIGPWGI